MSRIKYLKCSCGSCGGHIEFPSDGIGMTVDCPHCGQPVQLVPRPPIRTFAIILGLMVFLLVLIVVGALYFLKKMPATTAEEILSTQTNVPASTHPAILYVTALNDFKISRIDLQKSENGGLVYAVGTLKNNTAHQRFGVKITLDVLDAQTNRIGSASDYVATIEPHGEWSFKALLVAPKPASAAVAGIEEQK